MASKYGPGQIPSYSPLSPSFDDHAGEPFQTLYGDIDLDQVSATSPPYKSIYHFNQDDTVSTLTHRESRFDIAYKPATHPSPPAQLTIKKPGWETILADFVSIGAPLGLLTFAIVLWLKDGTEAEEETIREFQNAAQVLSTVFPVLFAAIIGRLMVQIARFKLERGSTLGSLEHFMGSRTVGGALLTPFHLQSFNLLALILLLLWAFSPLGAQSLLRFVQPRLTGVEESAEAGYFDTRAPPMFDEFAVSINWKAYDGAQIMNIVDRIYTGAVLAPVSVKQDHMDLWGNVKVPFLTTEDDGWKDVGDNVSYSALVGVPLANITNGNTTFEMESTYLSTVCEKPRFVNNTGIGGVDLNKTEIGETKRALPNYDGFHKTILGNGTYQGVGHTTSGPWSIITDRLIDISWANGTWIPNKCDPTTLAQTDENCTDLNREPLLDSVGLFLEEDGIEMGPTSLLWQAILTQLDASIRLGYGTYCNVTQAYVENKVECHKDESMFRENCRVSAQRPSTQKHAPNEINFLSFPRVMHIISQHMPQSGGPNMTSLTSSDFTLQYLAEPSLRNMSAPQEGSISFEDIPAKDFSDRLAQVLNTYIHIGQMYTDVTGSGNIRQSSTSPSKVIHAQTVYQVDQLWASWCLLSTVVLLAGGLAGTLLAHLATGPEVMGFASTLIRDSKYIRLPNNMAGAEGLDITQRLKDVRVRFGGLSEYGGNGTVVGTGFERNVQKLKEVK